MANQVTLQVGKTHLVIEPQFLPTVDTRIQVDGHLHKIRERGG